MDKEILKQLVNSPGWNELKGMFEDEIDRLSLPEVLENERFEDIAVKTIAKAKTITVIRKVLNNVENMANDQKVKPERYI